ncbi:hypothetical protein BST63_16970 [Bradyrhizobium canariense]|uniref:Uncharacterized protein n=1 Tax=Bradyrhizobium canariense TaxID=255045 RepID=A0ABX3X411_9BRAD|nr:hypothetical protein BSZ22_18425 [Bradyrhizobium canariense]OSI74783.1 hypothetical protein BSZ23_31230 [Bradyrhizobium canariense]OSJ28424.1 hypothetical protein BST63_16970 [Bradyrhizobium canariense]
MARKAGAARQASSDLVVGAAAFPEALLDTHDAGVAEVMQLLELRVHPGGEVWSSATAPAAGPSAMAATRPPSRP